MDVLPRFDGPEGYLFFIEQVYEDDPEDLAPEERARRRRERLQLSRRAQAALVAPLVAEATARVREALDRGEAPVLADLLACDQATRRTAYHAVPDADAVQMVRLVYPAT